jgi:hypothetical protein
MLPLSIKNDTCCREDGLRNEYPVRYPVGRKTRSECLFAIPYDTPSWTERLNYIEARKRNYLPLYIRLVREQPKFHKLLQRLLNGENLLIVEVDGPHEESLEYYAQ